MTLRAATLTYLALMALLALTVGSTFVPLGVGNTLLNVGIAAVKAALVGLVFMHLRRSGLLISLTVAVIGFWLLIFFAMTLTDFLAR